jgi:hypothetical protein
MVLKIDWKVFFFISLLIHEGCCLITSMASQEPKSTKEYESRIYDAPHEYTFQALEKVLREKGFNVRKIEGVEGLMESDFTIDGPVRSKVKAIVSPISKRKTKVELRLYVEKHAVWSNAWKPVETELSAYESIFDELELQIYRQYIEKIKDRSDY